MKTIILFISTILLTSSHNIAMDEMKMPGTINAPIFTSEIHPLDSDFQYLPKEPILNIITQVSPKDASAFFNTCKASNCFGLQIYFPTVFYPWVGILPNKFKWSNLSFSSKDEESRFNFLFLSNIARFFTICLLPDHKVPKEIQERRENFKTISFEIHGRAIECIKKYYSKNTENQSYMELFINWFNETSENPIIPLLIWFTSYADAECVINLNYNKSSPHIDMKFTSRLLFSKINTEIMKLNNKDALEVKLNNFIFKKFISFFNTNDSVDENNLAIHIRTYDFLGETTFTNDYCEIKIQQ